MSKGKELVDEVVGAAQTFQSACRETATHEERARIALNTARSRLLGYIQELESERERLRGGLCEMLAPPLILATDDATDVASWFVAIARRVLYESNEHAPDSQNESSETTNASGASVHG